MNAIRKILNVRKNEITIKGLKSLNNRAVEVIIIPVGEDKEEIPDKKELLKFRGIGSSGFKNTSRNVDSLIYDK